MSNLIGKQIGPYTILEEIGRGGMATVYSAMQTSMNRKIAIKVLPPHFMHDPGFLERFEREVAVISHLEHPHILPIYDYGQAEGVPYIAMRYLGGGSLAQRIRRGTIELTEIEKPFMQVCQALDYAHQQSVIHRDLKPGNIMLDEAGNAYLSDFGIARVMGSNLTGSAIIGTPAYMSPEQAHGLNIDGRADIYSMGVVLFELITGREPFQAETPMGLLLMHINEAMPPIYDFRQDIPGAVQDVVDKATAKNPDDRYSSAGQMASALSAAIHGGSSTSPVARDLGPLSTARPRTNPQTNIPTQNVRAEMADSRTMIGDAVGGTPIPSVLTGDTGRQSTGTTDISNRPRALWLLLPVVAVLLIVITGAALLLRQSPDSDIVPTVNPNAAPTPFRSAVMVDQPNYSLSIPQEWMPLNASFVDQSDAQRQYHVWQTDDLVARASLAVSDLSQKDYIDQYYAPQKEYTLVDEAKAPDGTVRRSYRMTQAVGDLQPGQIDVFFRADGKGVAVLELYTADSDATNRTMLTALQLILDSWRLKRTA